MLVGTRTPHYLTTDELVNPEAFVAQSVESDALAWHHSFLPVARPDTRAFDVSLHVAVPNKAVPFVRDLPRPPIDEREPTPPHTHTHTRTPLSPRRQEQAKLLYPNVPIECVLSVGTGYYVPKQNDAGMSWGTVINQLVNSATVSCCRLRWWWWWCC